MIYLFLTCLHPAGLRLHRSSCQSPLERTWEERPLLQYLSYGTDSLSVRECTLLSWSHCVLTQDLSSTWGPSNWPSLDTGQVTGRTRLSALDLNQWMDGGGSPATRQDRETIPGQSGGRWQGRINWVIGGQEDTVKLVDRWTERDS